MKKKIIAKFVCCTTKSIDDINYFILNGNIVEGELRIGQYINFVSSDFDSILKLKIAGIQFVDYLIDREIKLDIAVECSSPDELHRLHDLKLYNETGYVTNK